MEGTRRLWPRPAPALAAALALAVPLAVGSGALAEPIPSATHLVPPTPATPAGPAPSPALGYITPAAGTPVSGTTANAAPASCAFAVLVAAPDIDRAFLVPAPSMLGPTATTPERANCYPITTPVPLHQAQSGYETAAR